VTTKTEKLRAALLSRRFAPVDHVSQRECLQGKSTNGRDLWLWMDKTGGARYNFAPKKTEAVALINTTVELVIAGKTSKLISGGV
jgi:hypothetical protein